MRFSLHVVVLTTLFAMSYMASSYASNAEFLQPWTCPKSEVWVKCGDLHENLDYYGYPKIKSGYHDVHVYGPETKRHLDKCGRGYILRKWKIKYHYDWYTCTQKIHVGSTGGYGDFDPHYHISFPKDYDVQSCTGSTHPDNLPSTQGWPKLKSSYHGCSKVGIHYTDVTRPYHGYGHGYHKPCKVIHRTWEIVDWCQYDSHNWHWKDGKKVYKGQWFHVQKIYVYDTEAPVIVACPKDTSILTGDCYGAKVWIDIPALKASDNCGHAQISYSKKLLADEYGYGGSGSHSVQFSGGNASGYFHPGVTEVKYLVKDYCGNVTECGFKVTVEAKDTKPPRVIGVSSITLTLMQTDSSDGMREINPAIFNASSSDNCTADENLKFSLEPSVFTCEDFGTNEVKFTVEDEAGNTAYILVEVIIKAGSFDCMGGEVGGSVIGTDGQGVEGVDVTLSSEMSSVSTLENGSYSSTEIPLGYNLQVSPTKFDDPMKGVDMFDYMLLSMHVEGYREITDPYALLAADVDGSGAIDGADVWKMQKLITGVETDFGDVPAWKFMRSDFVMPDSVPLFEVILDDMYTHDVYNGEELTFDFTAIKMGDIGRAATNDPEVSNVEVVVNHLASDRQTMTVKSQDAMQSLLIPFSLAPGLDLQEVLAPELESLGKVEVIASENDQYLLSWIGYAEEVINEAEISIVHAESPSESASALRIESTRAKVALASNNQAEVSVQYQGAMQQFRSAVLAPNPFKLVTTLGFELHTAAEGTLSIRSADGKEVWSTKQHWQQGQNQIEITAQDLPTVGVYYYTLTSQEDAFTGRMMRID